MLFQFSAKRVTQALMLVVVLLTFISLGSRLINYVWGYEGFLALLPRFNVGQDLTIPTWYSSFMLLLCSSLLVTIAAMKKRDEDRYTIHWSALSIIFLLLSIDEVAALHEEGGEVFESLAEPLGFTASGFFYYPWVIPGAIFVLLILLTYLRFIADLPRQTRRLFLIAGSLFVLGALGMEMLTANVESLYGGYQNEPTNIKIVAVIQTTIEELLEMLGIVVFIYSLLSYISSSLKEVSVRVRH